MEKIIEIPEGYEARIEGNKVVLEPKESEDERIRKELIKYFINTGCNYIRGVPIENVIAYLEKQEQPEVDLEEDINACWQNWLSPSNQKEVEEVLPKTEFAMYARHFYELGKARKEE